MHILTKHLKFNIIICFNKRSNKSKNGNQVLLKILKWLARRITVLCTSILPPPQHTQLTWLCKQKTTIYYTVLIASHTVYSARCIHYIPFIHPVSPLSRFTVIRITRSKLELSFLNFKTTRADNYSYLTTYIILKEI